MYFFHEEIEQELSREKRTLNEAMREASRRQEGHLKRRKHIGRTTYYEITKEGDIVSDGMAQDDKRVVEIKHRRILAKQIEVIENNIKALEKLKSKYRRYSFEEINQSLPETYRIDEPRAEGRRAEGNFVGTVQPGAQSSERGTKRDSTRGTVQPGAQRSMYGTVQPGALAVKTGHTAIDGTPLRSMAEVVIYNLLKSYRIPFIYEQCLELGRGSDRESILPDFTILKRDGKRLYWEHIGMMGDDEYADRFLKKMKTYYRHNIVPGSNLILTFSKPDMSIDSAEIDRMIQNMIVPVVKIE